MASKQKWEIGQTVKVGFVSGLEVIGKVATPRRLHARPLRSGAGFDQAHLSLRPAQRPHPLQHAR
jgi:hypothetical protein